MDHRTELVDVIRGVRNRWRVRLALRGAVVVVAGTMLALLLSASGLKSFRFSVAGDHHLPARRGRRLRRAPALRARLAAAPPRHRRAGRDVSRGARPVARGRDHQRGRSHRARAVARALAASRRASSSNRRSSNAARSITAGASIAAPSSVTPARSPALPPLVALILAFGPAYLRHGLSALLVISRSAEASSPYSIQVTPGNAKVPRGADQTVHAKLWASRRTTSA